MRQVGRELEREQLVIEVEVGADVLTHGRVSGEFVQAIGGVDVDTQFGVRAQHAVTLNATQLADLNLKRLAIGTGGQQRAHGGTGHANTGARIGRTAHDGERFGLAN